MNLCGLWVARTPDLSDVNAKSERPPASDDVRSFEKPRGVARHRPPVFAGLATSWLHASFHTDRPMRMRFARTMQRVVTECRMRMRRIIWIDKLHFNGRFFCVEHPDDLRHHVGLGAPVARFVGL